MWNLTPNNNTNLEVPWWRENTRQLVDQGELLQIIEKVMGEELGKPQGGSQEPLPLDELAASPRFPKRPRRNEMGDVVTPGDFRFRYKRLPITFQGVLQKVTPEGEYEKLLSSLSAIRTELMAQDSNGAWALCAWEGVPWEKGTRARLTASPDHRWDIRDGTPKPQNTVLKPVKLPGIELRLVFYDASRNDEIDNWESETGRKDAPMQSWVQNEKLPPSRQKRRETCLDIVRRFVASQAPAPEVVAPRKGKRLQALAIPEPGGLEDHEL